MPPRRTGAAIRASACCPPVEAPSEDSTCVVALHRSSCRSWLCCSAALLLLIAGRVQARRGARSRTRRRDAGTRRAAGLHARLCGRARARANAGRTARRGRRHVRRRGVGRTAVPRRRRRRRSRRPLAHLSRARRPTRRRATPGTPPMRCASAATSCRSSPTARTRWSKRRSARRSPHASATTACPRRPIPPGRSMRTTWP